MIGRCIMNSNDLKKRTLQYLRPYRFRYLVLSLLGTAGFWALFTCYGFLLREIVMLLETPDQVRQSAKTIIFYLVITILASPLSGIAVHGIKWIELKTADQIRSDMLRSYMQAEEKDAQKYTVDDVEQRMTRDAAAVSTKMCGYELFSMTVEPILSGILSLITLGYFNVLLAVISFLIAAVNLFLIQLKADRSAELQKDRVEQDEEIVHRIMQVEDGRFEVHTFRMADVLLSSLQKKLSQQTKTIRSFNALNNFRNEFSAFFSGGLGLLILIFTGAVLARYHLIAFADVMVAMPMIDQISQMMIGFGRWKNTVAATAVSEKRIYEIVDLPRYDQTRKASDSISLEHVSFSYDGEHPALADCSLEIARNSHTAIVGENGSGKSTMLKLLLGLYQPDSGTLLAPALDQIAYMPQDQVLFYSPIKEYVSLSHQPDEAKVKHSLSETDCIDFVQAKGGLDALIEDSFSGGQKQRLDLSRCIYSERPFVFMDEPSAALDTAFEKKLEDLFQKEKNKTIVVTTHRLDLVRSFDQIIVMKDHRVAECGTHEQLLAKNGIYAAMYHQQKSETSKQQSD